MDLGREIISVSVAISAVVIGNDAAINAAEASLADELPSAEASSGGLEVGEREHSEIVGTAVNEEVVEGERIGELTRVRVELGAPSALDAARGHAQRSRPRHLGARRSGDSAAVFAAVSTVVALVSGDGEMKALH